MSKNHARPTYVYDLFGNIESLPLEILNHLGGLLDEALPAEVDVTLVKQAKGANDYSRGGNILGIVVCIDRSYKGTPIRERVSRGQAHTIVAYLRAGAPCLLLEYSGPDVKDSALSPLTLDGFLEGGSLAPLRMMAVNGKAVPEA